MYGDIFSRILVSLRRFDKDFDQVKIEADSEEEALRKVQEKYPSHITNT
jgi:hypothetical protein